MRRKDKKIVVITSGGMDSTVLLHDLHQWGYSLRALGFNYGQRHRRELQFASAQAARLEIPFSEVDLSSLRDLLPGSSQTDLNTAVPDGHYSEESMKATVVPNRNMIMLSIAIGHAIAHRMGYVAYGAHAGDHTIYPDCREEFVKALNRAAGLCDWHRVRIMRPFIDKSKAELVVIGTALGVDFSKTYSCYKGGEIHCGRCGTCIERREAFHLASVSDPTTYASDAPSLDLLVSKNWKI